MQVLNLIEPDESVFFCGSREIGPIENISDIPEALHELMECVHTHKKILVGDCTGIDELVQQYLLEVGYKNVEVYTSGEARVYLNTDWRLIECQADKKIDENLPLNEYMRAFYAVKDNVMCQNCDRLVAIWNRSSRATKNNIDRIIALNKSYHIIEI